MNQFGESIFTPSENSEEFVIQGMRKVSPRVLPPSPLTSVKPVATSATVVTPSSTGEFTIAEATDGDVGTHWQSREETAGTANVVVDFKDVKNVKTIKYVPRYAGTDHGYDATGRMKEYKIEYSADGNTWQTAVTGEFTQKGKFEAPEDIVLQNVIAAKKIKITATKSHMWDQTKLNRFLNIGELTILDDNNQSLIVKADTTKLWSITGSSVQNDDGSGYNALIDGKLNTFYHSRYKTENGVGGQALPVKLTLDRGSDHASAPFQTIGYVPRPNGSAASNGNVKEYEVYVTDDARDEVLFSSDNLKKVVNLDYTGVYDGSNPNYIYSSLSTPETGRYVGFKILTTTHPSVAAGTEIDLFKEKFDSNEFFAPTKIESSKLTLAEAPTVSDTTTTINKVKKEGKLIEFKFNPVDFGSGKVTVTQKVVMYNGDHFMRKFLEIDSTDKQARFAFIDGEHLALSSSDKKWTIPTDKGGVVSMEMPLSNLGQPIYINGMFFGSEFPAADTQIVDGLGRLRYHTGKNFEDFARDGQLTKDGKYVTWQTVVGASRNDGSNTQVVQADFFEYIYSIATPSEFRIQYNSWYDNMMFIDDENILSSFSAIDKQFSNAEVRPLDSYVVDDGWNNYRRTPDQYNDGEHLRRNGTAGKVNTTGFWEFNDKFPSKLTPSSNLVQNFGSNFGVWIGPRGGYNYQGNLAQIIADAQNGSSAGGSIDVADARYVQKYQEMALEWMQEYKVNYWKWDGFADSGQYGAFEKGEGVVGYRNHHMYGGPHGFYHSTDLWEKWIDLMEKVREKADNIDIHKLWISLTCYVNPSPWFLQWANSVWLQCVADKGERWNSVLNDKMNNMLTYRDGTYYDFIKNHQFQFPLANIYNHDPIYGKEGTGISANSMTGDQFRNFMYMQGTRGTSFWELYYSVDLLDEEKYLITSDYLEFAEANFAQLRNAKMIGGDPDTNSRLTSGVNEAAATQDTYGFAGFNEKGGIVSFRNPSATTDTISFKLDEAIGVTKEGTYHTKLISGYSNGAATLKGISPSFNKGDTVTVSLEPGELYIWQFSLEKDSVKPTLNRLFFKDANTIQVRVDEHVKDAQFSVKVDGVEVAHQVKALKDLRTFNLTLDKPLTSKSNVVVTPTAGTDFANNAFNDATVQKTYYQDGIVAELEKVHNDNTLLASAQNSLETSNGFSVTATVKDGKANTVLVKQGDNYELGIDANGHPYFTLNKTTVTAKDAVVTGYNQIITAVKENNGMMKIYIDGKISKAAFEKDNKNFLVNKADIIVNQNSAELRDVAVYNRSLGYDEVPQVLLAQLVKTVESNLNIYTEASVNENAINRLLQESKPLLNGNDHEAQNHKYTELHDAYLRLVPKTSVNIALNRPVIANWTTPSAFPAQNSGRALSVAVDGRLNTAEGYTIFGNNNNRASAYIQIDLGDVARIDDIQLYRYWTDARTYESTAVVVSKDETFNEKQVLYYSGSNKTVDTHSLGQLPTQDLYAESPAGKEVFKATDTNITARFVRIYGTGNNINNENHVVEVLVNGMYLSADVYNLKPFEATIKVAEEKLAQGIYTDETIASLTTVLEQSKAVVAEVKANTQVDKTIGYVINKHEQLKEAIAKLAEKDADYTTLNALVKSVENYNPQNYKNFEVVTTAVNAIEQNLKVSKQEKVNEFEKALQDAIQSLQRKDEIVLSKGEVEVHVIEGTLPEFAGVEVQKVDKAIPGFSKENSDLYDITINDVKSNAVVKFNGKANIYLPLREGKTADDIEGVYYVDPSNVKHSLAYTVVGRTVMASVEHFSEYGIAYKAEVANNTTPTTPTVPNNTTTDTVKPVNTTQSNTTTTKDVNTSDNSVGLIGMLSLSLAGLLLLRKKQYK